MDATEEVVKQKSQQQHDWNSSTQVQQQQDDWNSEGESLYHRTELLLSPEPVRGGFSSRGSYRRDWMQKGQERSPSPPPPHKYPFADEMKLKVVHGGGVHGGGPPTREAIKAESGPAIAVRRRSPVKEKPRGLWEPSGFEAHSGEQQSAKQSAKQAFTSIAERKMHLLQMQKDRQRRERNPQKKEDHGGNPAGSPKRAAERNRGASLYGSTGSGHAKHASDWDSTVGSGAPVRQVRGMQGARVKSSIQAGEESADSANQDVQEWIRRLQPSIELVESEANQSS